MNGRLYDYNLGRFLSVDPFIHGAGNSQGINPYSYILNNPLAGTDPTGYKPCTDMLDNNCGDVSIDAVMAENQQSVNFGKEGLDLGNSGYSVSNKSSAEESENGFEENQNSSNENSDGSTEPENIGSQANTAKKESRKGFGKEKTVHTYRQVFDADEQEKLFDEAKAMLKTKLEKSGAFKTEELRQQYIELFDETSFVLRTHKEDDPGTPAIAFYSSKRIIGYRGLMKIRTRNGRDAPRVVSVNRIAKILAHELRHLTDANNKLPSNGGRSLLSQDQHKTDPSEIDANLFMDRLFDRNSKKGTIDDF